MLLVFDAQESVLDAIHLSMACRGFQALWQKRYHGITNTILSREIPSYSDALVLAEAQGRFDPQIYHRNLRKAESRLRHLTSYAVPNQSEVEDVRNIVVKYQASIELAGDGGCSEEYDLHMRKIQRLQLNKKDATIIAELCTGFELPKARHNGRWYQESKPYQCPFHPMHKPVSHEIERAIQCVYFARLCSLGHVDNKILSQYRLLADQMPIEKLVTVWAFVKRFLPQWDQKAREARRVLGVHDKIAESDDLLPRRQMLITDEWKGARNMSLWLIGERTGRDFGELAEKMKQFEGPCDKRDHSGKRGACMGIRGWSGIWEEGG